MAEKVRFVRSPIGVYKVTADCNGIVSVELVAEDESVLDQIPSATECGKNEGNDAEVHMNNAAKWLEAYFKDPSKVAQIKRPKINTERYAKNQFRRKVWKVLTEKIGPGSTISYGELAKLAGNHKAARAVGMAMKTNPVSIIVPCHRVITSRGQLGNYSSLNGSKTKRWLLEHEKMPVAN